MNLRQTLLLRFGGCIGLVLLLYLVADSIVQYHSTYRNVEENLRNITEAIRTTAETAYEVYQEAVSRNLNVANTFVEERSRLNADQQVQHTIENQISLERRSVSLPAFQVRAAGG